MFIVFVFYFLLLFRGVQLPVTFAVKQGKTSTEHYICFPFF